MLDGEAMGIRDDGSPRRFQDTMGDFGADEAGRGDGLQPFFFDVLHVGGSPVHDEPLSARRELLEATVPAAARLPSIVTADAVEADEIFTVLMGDTVEPRRRFIENNALNVRNLDI